MDESFASDDYLIDKYAHLVAEQTSGIQGAIPEQADFNIAKEILGYAEKMIRG